MIWRIVPDSDITPFWITSGWAVILSESGARMNKTPCSSSSNFPLKGRDGQWELLRLPVEGVDILRAGVAQQEE